MQANQAIDQLEQLKTDECDLPYAQLRKAMFDYNEKLYLSGQSGLIDQLSYEKPDFYSPITGLTAIYSAT